MKSSNAKIIAINRSSKFYPLVIIYIVIVSIYMLWHRAWFSPDQFFAVALFAILFIGRLSTFLSDWAPLLVLFFSYEYLRGLAPILNGEAHIMAMINVDKFIFGFVPPIKLQQILHSTNGPHWYDYVASALYISYFIVPMMVGFLFWLYDANLFKKYMRALLFLSFAAFVTYVLFPAMPPWLASQNGYLPKLAKIMDASMANFGQPINLPSTYKFLRADQVAAVPSLHAAYPFLIFLFLGRKSKRLALLTSPYVLGVWFSVIYLGEHYFIDVLLGAIYAAFSYFIVLNFAKIRKTAIHLASFV